jgi:hypothetical protein
MRNTVSANAAAQRRGPIPADSPRGDRRPADAHRSDHALLEPLRDPFVPSSLGTGRLLPAGTRRQPLGLWGWSNGDLPLAARWTHFGFVQSGTASLACRSGSFELAAGMYFCVPGRGAIAGAGTGVVFSSAGGRGFFQIGGPIEQCGRLKYIDGCTDSLLIPPLVMGDPCLNLLHIPRGVRQTAHTHPSDRLGLIVRGRGQCLTSGANFALAPGLAFVIPAGAVHSFRTTRSSLTVIAFHPDSDFGPQDENHPMINRTVISQSGG